jgi:hypothetical protein
VNRLKLASTLVIGLAMAATVSTAAPGQQQQRLAADGAPLLGMNLIQYEFTPPNCWGRHIILNYHEGAVRTQVVAALQAMRAAAVETFRLFLYHSHTIDRFGWPLDSSSGELREPHRGNLIRFLSDIRTAGFKQVTATFNPWGNNDPTGMYPGDPYDPSLFSENWSFIRSVRPLAKHYGPSSTKFDLINEGAPNNWLNHDSWMDYVTHMYRNYVDAYGNADVTISAIAKSKEYAEDTSDDVTRMQNLIDALRASGRPLPTWFAVHPSWNARAVDDLLAVDAVLTDNGLSQPLVISESRYNDPEMAASIDTFIDSSARPVLEVMQWGALSDIGSQPQPRCVKLPYVVDAYAKALRSGVAPKTLQGSVSRRGDLSLRTQNGDSVRALIAGTYTLTVRDRSRKHSFQLTKSNYVYPVGADRGAVIHQSGISFTGARTWAVRLRPGRYLYVSQGLGGTRSAFDVLAPG